MEIGTLNRRITFLVNRVVTDEIGNHTAMWDEAFSCWAKVTLKASSEHWQRSRFSLAWRFSGQPFSWQYPQGLHIPANPA